MKLPPLILIFLTTILAIPLSASAASGISNVILDWNATALEAIRVHSTSPPYAARNLAMLHAAMFDAANGITQQYEPYHTPLTTDPSLPTDIAAAAAAREILTHLYPERKDMIAAQYESTLKNTTANSIARQQAESFGQQVTADIIEWRQSDGADTKQPYQTQGNLGTWQPSSPYFLPALLPQWQDVTPFAITDPAAYRPSGPAALNTAQYAQEFNEVKRLGDKTSSIRTADQTEIAHFWEDGRGTYTPPGHWNVIAQDMARQHNLSTLNSARLFLLLNTALADAGIASWECKYYFDYWRPVVAIRQADQDGNAATEPDSNWIPLLETPPFPEYVSGHSTFSGAASTVLAAFFGPNTPFTTHAVNFTSVERSYDNFAQAAEEAGMSRIYGGIHYQSANQHGLTMGRQIGQYAIEHIAQPKSATPAPPVPVSAAAGAELALLALLITAIGATATWHLLQKTTLIP